MPRTARRPLIALVLLLAALLTGCQAQAAPTAQTTPVGITVQINDGSVSPSGDRVAVYGGSEVTLTITAAHDDVVHVHGYELEIPVKKGETVTKTFVADKLGRYEIESHHPAMIIALLDVS